MACRDDLRLSRHPHANRGEQHEAEKVYRSFLVTGRDSSISLNFAEEILERDGAPDKHDGRSLVGPFGLIWTG
jgi:hypothetical protein